MGFFACRTCCVIAGAPSVNEHPGRSCATQRFRCNQVFRRTFDGLALEIEQLEQAVRKLIFSGALVSD